MTCTTITAYRERKHTFEDAAQKAKAAGNFAAAISFTGEVRALNNMITDHQCGPQCMEEKKPESKTQTSRV